MLWEKLLFTQQASTVPTPFPSNNIAQGIIFRWPWQHTLKNFCLNYSGKHKFLLTMVPSIVGEKMWPSFHIKQRLIWDFQHKHIIWCQGSFLKKERALSSIPRSLIRHSWRRIWVRMHCIWLEVHPLVLSPAFVYSAILYKYSDRTSSCAYQPAKCLRLTKIVMCWGCSVSDFTFFTYREKGRQLRWLTPSWSKLAWNTMLPTQGAFFFKGETKSSGKEEGHVSNSSCRKIS